ncbi:MAG: M20/M25/M40 family metallo-hydrolase [Muribaculum sp.]|nr:M20/M25/M40 family metallo-hydrolase [Muribaculaceae bacterium]MCM1080716.1 M20/M25/M40 family metallo-hydrolase [Muribaculum sp.]
MNIDRDELFYQALDLLRKLISVESLSRNESRAADILVEFFESFGFKTERFGNNVLVKSPDFNSDKPTILLNSHIDTVKPADGWLTNPFVPTDNGDRIIGLGSNDAGASVVSLAAAFIELCSVRQSSNYIFLASCEEEVSGSGGIESVVPLLSPIAVAIVGEPTQMRAAVSEKGLMVLDGVIHGRAGHAARNEGENAIYKAVEVVEILRNLKFERESQTLGPVKISVTQIEAGTQHNVVPALCKIVVDVRTTDSYSNQETLELIRQAVGSRAVLTPRSTRLNPSGIALNHPLIERLQTLGIETFGSPTLSDQALMPWPSVKIGPGDSARSHSANEYICIGEIRSAIALYVSALNGLTI